ncbi:MAG: alpha/beta hydrolase [Chthoniobacter sp.]|nr:alpha/beta hydrolase [Chthoniobacter sp.]
MTKEQAEVLRPLTVERYRVMALSPHFAKATSALPYAFSDQKPAHGVASAYVPAGATAKTPVILFLHGYGGSFLWYQHYLSEIFPNHIIICPAYGISTATISQEYVAESLAAVSKQLGFRLSSPCLIGLSAGGFGACRLYVATPTFYTQLICLAAFPTDDTLARFLRNSRPRFLSGGTEPFVNSGDFQKRIAIIRRTAPAVEESTIPGADHFFLLTHPKETKEQLLRWLPADSN